MSQKIVMKEGQKKRIGICKDIEIERKNFGFVLKDTIVPMGNGIVWLTWTELRLIYELGVKLGEIEN